MAFCSQCGSQTSPEAKFCPQCGADKATGKSKYPNTEQLEIKTSGNLWVWVTIALIIAIAIIVATFLFTQSQTHPFWEIK